MPTLAAKDETGTTIAATCAAFIDKQRAV